MVGDAKGREAVRQLMKRFEFITAQGLGMAYVLAKKDPLEYSRLLESAERATTLVIQPVIQADSEHSQVYKALDDPDADWPKAVFAMLNHGPVLLTGERAIERLKFIQSLEERFDAEMKDRNKSDEEPGIGNGG